MMVKQTAALQIQQPDGTALVSSPRTVCPSGSDMIIDDTPPTLRDAMDYAVWVVGQARRRRRSLLESRSEAEGNG